MQLQSRDSTVSSLYMHIHLNEYLFKLVCFSIKFDDGAYSHSPHSRFRLLPPAFSARMASEPSTNESVCTHGVLGVMPDIALSFLHGATSEMLEEEVYGLGLVPLEDVPSLVAADLQVQDRVQPRPMNDTTVPPQLMVMNDTGAQSQPMNATAMPSEPMPNAGSPTQPMTDAGEPHMAMDDCEVHAADPAPSCEKEVELVLYVDPP